MNIVRPTRDDQHADGDGRADTAERLYSDAERAIADRWKCGADNCTTLVEVTAAAQDALAAFNRIERSRGQFPIDKSKVVMCDACAKWFRGMQAERTAKVSDELGRMIRLLKDSSTPTHRLGEAEMYVAKYANEGPDIVRHLAGVRAGVSASRPTRKSW